MKILLFLFLLLINDAARDGNKAYEEGNFAKAEQFYKQALSDSPKDARILYNLANALAQQDKFEEAIATYETFKHLAEDPSEKAKADYNIGNTLGKMKKWDQALKYYKEALKSNPTDDEAKYNYELAYKQKQDQEKNKDKNKDDKNDQNKDDKKDDKKDEQNKEDKKDQNKDENQQNKDGKDDQKKDEKQQQENSKPDDKPQDQKGNPKPLEAQMSKEQAEKILQALDKKERDLLQQFKKPKTDKNRNKNDKDW